MVVTLTAITSSRTLGNTFGNTDIDGFRSPDRHCCPQIEERLVGIICGTLPRLTMNAYIRKNYTAASLSSCLFIQTRESCRAVSNTSHGLTTYFFLPLKMATARCT